MWYFLFGLNESRKTHSAEQLEQLCCEANFPVSETAFPLFRFLRQNLFFAFTSARVIAEPKIIYVIISCTISTKTDFQYCTQ